MQINIGKGNVPLDVDLARLGFTQSLDNHGGVPRYIIKRGLREILQNTNANAVSKLDEAGAKVKALELSTKKLNALYAGVVRTVEPVAVESARDAFLRERAVAAGYRDAGTWEASNPSQFSEVAAKYDEFMGGIKSKV